MPVAVVREPLDPPDERAGVGIRRVVRQQHPHQCSKRAVLGIRV
jgi:hypothetical protein